MNNKKTAIDKEFQLSSWAIKNKTTIYVLMFLMLYFGISAYFTMPRENFPEINETKIYISSVYPGNTAEDIEKLITNPLEDKLKESEDKLLRSLAEIENQRRRFEKEIKDAFEFGENYLHITRRLFDYYRRI